MASDYSFVKDLLTKARPLHGRAFFVSTFQQKSLPLIAHSGQSFRCLCQTVMMGEAVSEDIQPLGMNDISYPASSKRPQRPLILVSLVLIPVALFYIGQGVANLAFRGNPFDLRQRWVDQQYIFHRQNPYDVMFFAKAMQHGDAPPRTSRNTAADTAIGAPWSGGYPPWSFFSGAVLVGLPWNAERVYFAILNLAALGFLGGWGFSIGRKFGTEVGIFLAAATAAMGANRVTLSFGQYGILVNALLVGALVLEERRRPILSGLMLGIAMLKPNIAAPFMLCFLIQRRFKALTSAIAYLIAASLVIWAVTHTNPLEMIRQMLTTSQEYITNSTSILKAVIKIGVPMTKAIVIVAAGGMFVGGVLMLRLRDGSLLTQFAIACVIARFWTYHHPYDDLVLIFLLVRLAQGMLKRPTVPDTIAFWLVGLSLLWLPLGYEGFRWPLAVVQHLAWSFGLLVVLYRELNSGATDVSSPRDC
jgi:hypothetical protein